MTKSTITRERLEWLSQISCRDDIEDIGGDEIRELASIALAAMDSEPVAWTWHYREQWHVTNDKCRAEFVAKDGDVDVLPLYRHAQPAPEAMPECFRNAVSALESLYRNGQKQCWHERYTTDMAYASGVLNACRAAMLQAKSLTSINPAPALVSLQKNAKSLTGNSPVIGIDLASGPDRTVEVRYVAPPGYVMVPMRLTAENGAKGALSGEFSETKFVNCPECFGDDECETCDGSGRIEITVPVTWTTIKEIWAKGVEHFAAAPQSPGSEPATVPGKWIPVSERMPEVGDIVLTAMGGVVNVGEMECSAANCRFFTSVISGRELPATHWLPLPAGPKEDINALIPLVSRNEQEGK